MEKLLKTSKFVDCEMKIKSRFLVEFSENFRKFKHLPENLEVFVFSCNKPKIVNNKWEKIKIEFYDPISPSTSQVLYKIAEILTHPDFTKSLLKEIILKALDPCEHEVEKWTIYIKNIDIDFGDYFINDDSVIKPSITITPSRCVLNY